MAALAPWHVMIARIVRFQPDRFHFPPQIEQQASRSLLAFVLSCGATLASEGQDVGDFVTGRMK
jgi:hypothetical protein